MSHALPQVSGGSVDDSRFGGGSYGKIVLSLACNNHCFFCYDQVERHRYKGMKEEEVRKNIDLAAANGVQVLTFIGGEVTLVPYFLRALEYAKGRFRDIHINTNGRSFHDAAFARACVDAGLNQVDVSLHGSTPAIHDAMVGAPGAYDELVQGLKNLVQLRDVGKKDVKLSATSIVSTANHHDLVNVGGVLRGLGVTSYRVKYAFEPDHVDVAEARAWVPTFTESMPGVAALLDAHGEALHVRTHDIPFCILGRHLRASSDFHRITLDIYWPQETERAPQFSRRFARSKKCEGCFFEHACCQAVGRYVEAHGDGELHPYDAASAEPVRQLLEARARAGERLAALDAILKSRRWKDAVDVCDAVLADDPENTQALRVKRDATRRLLNDEAEGLLRRGDRAGHQRVMERLRAEGLDPRHG